MILKRIKDLAYDSLTYGASGLLGQLIGFLLLPLYTQYLTPRDYGILALVIFIPQFFAPISSMGITNAIFRRYNFHNEEEKRKSSLFTANLSILITSLIWLIIGLLFSKEISIILTNSHENYHIIRVSFFIAFFTSITSVFYVILRAMRKVLQLSAIRLVDTFVTILSTIAFVVLLDLGVIGVLFGTLIGKILALIIQYISFFELVKFKMNFKEFKALLSYGIPFLPHRLFSYGIVFFTQFLIKEYYGLEQSGLFSIALRFIIPLEFFVTSVQNAWVPIKFQIHREHKSNAPNILSKLITIYTLGLLFVFSINLIIGPDLLIFMTEDTFNEAIYYFPFALLIPFAKGIYYKMGTGFELTNNTKPMPIISFAGLVSLGLFFIVSYDLLGMYSIILASVFSWLIMALVMRYFSARRTYVSINYFIILISLLLSFIFAGLVYTTIDFSIVHKSLLYLLIMSFSIMLIIYSLKKLNYLENIKLSKIELYGKIKNIFNKNS